MMKKLARWVIGAAAAAALGPVTTPLSAQQPATPLLPAQQSATPDLEGRVRELEALVRTLQTDRVPPAAGGDVAAQAAQPGQSASPVPDGAGVPGGGATGGTAGGGTSSLAGGGPPRGTNELGRNPTGPPGIALTQPGQNATFNAGWDNGFFLKSSDGNFNMRLTGQIQLDNRGYLDGSDTTDIDTFLLRRARLGIEADVFKFYEFRLLPDFGQAQPRITDAYMNIHYLDAIQVEVGKFKQPFSYEQLIQDRYNPTVERSLIDQFVPQRDEGLMIHGQNLLDGRIDYAASVFNGTINGDGDTNDRKDVAARIAVRPFFDSSRPGTTPLGHLQFGFAVTSGIEQEAISPNPLRTPSMIPWLTYNTGVRASGLRNRYSPELVYFYGPLGFASQYFDESQEMANTTNRLVNVHFRGGYALVTLFVTGEERTAYSQLTRPLRPFDPASPFTNYGAWELVARASRMTVGSEAFAGGAANLVAAAGNSRGATEMTLGFNWYLNAYVRVQFNYEHSWFDDPIRLGTGTRGLLRHDDALLTRLQVIF